MKTLKYNKKHKLKESTNLTIICCKNNVHNYVYLLYGGQHYDYSNIIIISAMT